MRLLGYSVERNVTINGCQIDIFGEYRTGVIPLKVMVECKDYQKKTVGIEDINKFAGVVAVARNMGAIDKGLFVTTEGYTASAKLNARSAGIELTTYKDLSTHLVDFDSYIERIIDEFESAPFSKYYIDLSGTEEEDYDGTDPSLFHRPIDKYINSHLFSEDHKKLALLGNFGTGKSTFCKKYARDLAKLYKSDRTSRIPILISLSEYDSKLHIQQLVLNTLQFRYNIHITNTLSQELQRIGRFVMLFDGFDEMATRVDPDTIRENLREINKVSEIAQNKFLLTCRTHFFRDRIQAEVLTDFDVLYIPEWGEQELQEYLQKRFGNSWRSELKRIVGTHNLPELAQTPLFLEMIVDTLPKLGDEVKRIELYKVYTNSWIQDQSRRKGARLSAEQRSQFVKELAIKLYREKSGDCHHSDFVPIIRQWFDVDDAAQLDYLRSDVQTCTFLTRSSHGRYGFRHASFMEFFVAQSLAEKIRLGMSDDLSETALPLEIRSFLVDLLADNPPIEILKEWMESDKDILRNNVLSLLPRLGMIAISSNIEEASEKDREALFAAQVMRGDADAFDALYRKYRAGLINYISRVMRDSDLAEDIAIETIVSAWQHRDRLSNIENLQGYLLSIAKNKCFDTLKRQKRDRSILLSLDSGEVPDQIADEQDEIRLSQQERLTRMEKALDSLPKQDRELVLRYFGEKKSRENLARELGVTLNALRIRVYRIRLRLNETLFE